MINIRVVKAILAMPPIASVESTEDRKAKELFFNVLVSQLNVSNCEYLLGKKNANEYGFDIEKFLAAGVQMYPSDVGNKRGLLIALHNLAVETGDQDGAGEIKQLIDNLK